MFGDLKQKQKSTFFVSIHKREEDKGTGKEEPESRTKKERGRIWKSRGVFNNGQVVSLQ